MDTNSREITELNRIAARFQQAASPEEVFGLLDGTIGEQLAGLKRAYRQLARRVHPDLYPAGPAKITAEEAFRLLAKWQAVAQDLIRTGMYASPTGAVTSHPVTLRTSKREYRIHASYTTDTLYQIYPSLYEEGGQLVPAELKIVRQPHDNDLAQNEAKVLHILMNGREAANYSAYIPSLVDAFLYEDPGSSRQALVFKRLQGWYSFEQVRQTYPFGLDPKDMAWMFRRLLVAVGFAHVNDLIHGGVLPKNIFIHPEQHGLQLANWYSAVRDPLRTGERIVAIDLAYRPWYPPEIFNKEAPQPGTDISMAAKCMLYLLGGDPQTGTVPVTVPKPIHMFLKGCSLPTERRRPQDAWGLVAEFDDLLRSLWGKRTYHPFSMINTYS